MLKNQISSRLWMEHVGLIIDCQLARIHMNWETMQTQNVQQRFCECRFLEVFCAPKVISEFYVYCYPDQCNDSKAQFFLFLPREQTVLSSSPPGPEVIIFLCSTRLGMGFQLLIKTKMLKDIGILCFQSLRRSVYPAHKC